MGRDPPLTPKRIIGTPPPPFSRLLVGRCVGGGGICMGMRYFGVGLLGGGGGHP